MALGHFIGVDIFYGGPVLLLTCEIVDIKKWIFRHVAFLVVDILSGNPGNGAVTKRLKQNQKLLFFL